LHFLPLACHPLHATAVTFWLLDLVDCSLRQKGQKPKPQPELCGPAGHYQYRTAARKINAQSPSCTHCQSFTLTGAFPLAGWLWLPQAARDPTRKRASRLKVKPPAPNHWGATAVHPSAFKWLTAQPGIYSSVGALF